MKLYKFTRLIKKYNVNFIIKPPTEQENGLRRDEFDNLGNPILPQPPILPENANGALIPPSDTDTYSDGGRMKRSDRILYYQGVYLPPKTRVIHKGKTYYVEGDADFLDFGDFTRYNLRGVDVFD